LKYHIKIKKMILFFTIKRPEKQAKVES